MSGQRRIEEDLPEEGEEGSAFDAEAKVENEVYAEEINDIRQSLRDKGIDDSIFNSYKVTSDIHGFKQELAEEDKLHERAIGARYQEDDDSDMFSGRYVEKGSQHDLVNKEET